MSKKLEEIKLLRECQVYLSTQLTDILKDFEERLKMVEAGLGIYTNEEIKKIKVGGTVPD